MLLSKNNRSVKEFRLVRSVLHVFGVLGLLFIALALAIASHVGQRNIDEDIAHRFDQVFLGFESLLESRLAVMDAYLDAKISRNFFECSAWR